MNCEDHIDVTPERNTANTAASQSLRGNEPINLSESNRQDLADFERLLAQYKAKVYEAHVDLFR